jgi:hypothetical protein
VDNVIDAQRIDERCVTVGQPIETAAIPARPAMSAYRRTPHCTPTTHRICWINRLRAPIAPPLAHSAPIVPQNRFPDRHRAGKAPGLSQNDDVHVIHALHPQAQGGNEGKDTSCSTSRRSAISP